MPGAGVAMGTVGETGQRKNGGRLFEPERKGGLSWPDAEKARGEGTGLNVATRCGKDEEKDQDLGRSIFSKQGGRKTGEKRFANQAVEP